MKKIFSIIALVLIAISGVSAQKNTKEAVAGEPVAGFKQIQIPNDLKSSKVFSAQSTDFKKHFVEVKGTKMVVYLDKDGKMVYIGSTGNSTFTNKPKSWWDKMVNYNVCIYNATSDSSTAACMAIWE